MNTQFTRKIIGQTTTNGAMEKGYGGSTKLSAGGNCQKIFIGNNLV